MGNASFSNDRFGRSHVPPPAWRDPFKERAEREAAKRAAKAKALFASPRRGPASVAGFHNPFEAKPRVEMQPVGALTPPPPPRPSWRTLANGVVLKVIASRADAVSVKKLEREEALRTRQAGKSSSLVLVSTGGAMTASSEPVAAGGGGQGELVIPASVPAEPKAPKRSGGGGGSASGGPPRDRVFNQDDLMGVLIVLIMLLLLALYLIRGGGGAPAAVNPIVSTQFAANEPAAPPAPLVDPFGDKPVDLTPKSPLPPEAAVAPAPAPAPACQPRVMRAWFCTAKSELTETARAALEKDLTELSSCLTGKELVVTGYADTRGSPDYNSVLGGARASVVAQLLKAKGVKVAELAGIGELPDLADNQDCSNQRRVDVRLADGPAEPPSKSCAPPDEFAALSCG
jgi:outer membrane protein OmpA-like peptidoglycan-associated protein